MIKNLRLVNFKSWEDTKDIKLSSLSGFFGTNSSGKTSLIQSLLLLKQTVESSDRKLTLDFGKADFSIVELGSFTDTIFKHEETRSFEFYINWDLTIPLKIPNPENSKETLFEGPEMGFYSKINKTNGDLPSVEQMDYSFSGGEFSFKRRSIKPRLEYLLETQNTEFRFKMSQGRKWYLPSPIKFYGFPDEVKFHYQNAGFLSDFQYELEQLFTRIFYLGPLRDYPKREYSWSGEEPNDMGRRGERAIDAILVSDSRGYKISRGKGKSKWLLSQFVAHWLKELELIHSFTIKPLIEGSNYYRVWVRKTPESSEVLLTDVGFGVSQILPVITLCYYAPEGSTILIEQPEIHLHPKVQAGLADVFIHASQTRNIQIILESHSEHLLRRLQRRTAEFGLDRQDKGINAENVSLYFCDTMKGASVISPLKLDSFGNISNYPINFFGDEFGEIAAMNKAKIERQKKALNNQ
jgi:AAA15 family ATPase/GTPase